MSNATNAPQSPALPVLNLRVRAEIRNVSQFTPTEGSNAGRTYYTATAELSTPGAKWSTMRLRVRGRTPIPEGLHDLAVLSLDYNKGEGLAECIEGNANA